MQVDVVGCHKNTISWELKNGPVTQITSDLKTFQTCFPETGQLRYEENRKACGEKKMKLNQAIESVQFAESKILDDQ